MGKDGTETLMWLALLVFGIAFILTLYLLFLMATGFIAIIIAYRRYKKYRKEAEEEFDQIVQETGVDLPFDDMAYAIGLFGVEPPEGEFDTVMDWMAGSAIGTSEK